ncbi:FKBP12-associated protein [Oleoguttula sp. CCFEE 5521]
MSCAERIPSKPEDSTSTCATQEFFAIVELVEQVLLDESVTMENLFVLQRINKSVQEIIHGSQPLQRKMCLAFDSKADSKAPTRYNATFSIPPGYLGRFPYQSVTNKRISEAFGTFTVVLLPDIEGGLMMGPTLSRGPGRIC